MSDILSAFAILLGVYTYIKSIFSERIDGVLEIKVEVHKIDNKSAYKKVNKTMKFFQLPLVLSSLVISLIMLPESLKIIKSNYTLFINKNFSYDIVSTSLVFINLIFALILFSEIFVLCKFVKKLKKLQYK